MEINWEKAKVLIVAREEEQIEITIENYKIRKTMTCLSTLIDWKFDVKI